MKIDAEMTLATPELPCREVKLSAEYDWDDKAFCQQSDVEASCIGCGQAVKLTARERWAAEAVLDEQARDYVRAEIEGAVQP